MLPGLKRPIIKTEDYAIEDETGEMFTVVNPGNKAYLRLDHPALQPGIFLLVHTNLSKR